MVELWSEFVFKKALSLHQKGQFAAAAVAYRKVLKNDPRNAEALHNLGVIDLQTKNPSAALALFDRAIALNPNNPLFFCNRGNALRDLARPDEALASFDRALAIKPDLVEALGNRGHTLRDLNRHEDALCSFDLALMSRPDYVRAWAGRGAALQSLKRLRDALASYDRAVAIEPNDPRTLNDRGNVLRELNRLNEALADYDRALEVAPNYLFAHINRGSVLKLLGRFDEAVASFDRVMTADPRNASVFSMRLLCKLTICDWSGLEQDLARFAELAAFARNAPEPFPVLIALSAEQQKSCTEAYIRQSHPPNSLLPGKRTRFNHDRIRLGYFSSDFGDHPVGHAISGLIEHHDRNKFEATGFAFRLTRDDPVKVRLEKTFDHFYDVSTRTDQDVAALARHLEIDIAVDLNGLTGFTEGNRIGIFANRAAPIQVNYLGYPGTMGADFIDYLIADRTVIPERDRQYYTEKIAYLPETYFPGSAERALAKLDISRNECGLPEKAFVFCCFNNAFKITPEIFDIWMRLLKRVDGSVLWLPSCNEITVRNLQSEATARDIGMERLVFAGFVPDRITHLNRLGVADLFLDTLPYNAHATAQNALCAGLPVLTCLGKTFPGRVAASMLHAAGLSELVTHTLSEYEALALELSTNRQKLLSLKQRLRANHSTHPLFDPVRFARGIESLYVAMLNQNNTGLPPVHIGSVA